MTIRNFRNFLLSCTILVAGGFNFTQVAGATSLQQPASGIQPVALAQNILRDGSFVGNGYDAYYGVVQVQAVVRNGQLADVKALQFPNHSGESRSINRQALPMLLQEAVSAQNARVRIISGATLTSRAYIASLNDALAQAGN